MNTEEIIRTFEGYKNDFENYLSRYTSTNSGLHINSDDDPKYGQQIREVMELFQDCLGNNAYSSKIADNFNWGIQNFTGSPSYKSMENIIGILGAALTRFRRNPGLLTRKKAQNILRKRENVFIIHGKDEAKWRELKDMIKEEFRLNPIILQEQPDAGCKTVIEKFEHYAEQCSYAVAVFTPDDEVNDGSEPYLQARPNVIYELGWFCGRLGRDGAMLLLKEGTSVFSDFGGIIQKRFTKNIREILLEIKKDLIAGGVLDDV
jgi:predicted nucleotide-binding protein